MSCAAPELARCRRGCRGKPYPEPKTWCTQAVNACTAEGSEQSASKEKVEEAWCAGFCGRPRVARSLSGNAVAGAQVRLSADLLGSGANRSLAAHVGPNGLSPPTSAVRVLVLNNTQPLLGSSGQLRWALNNVATYKTPSCLPTLAQARRPASMLAWSALTAVGGPAGGCAPELILSRHAHSMWLHTTPK